MGILETLRGPQAPSLVAAIGCAIVDALQAQESAGQEKFRPEFLSLNENGHPVIESSSGTVQVQDPVTFHENLYSGMNYSRTLRQILGSSRLIAGPNSNDKS